MIIETGAMALITGHQITFFTNIFNQKGLALSKEGMIMSETATF